MEHVAAGGRIELEEAQGGADEAPILRVGRLIGPRRAGLAGPRGHLHQQLAPPGSACSKRTLTPSVRFHPASASRASILTRENASVVPVIGPLRPVLHGRFHASAHGLTTSPRFHLVIETTDRGARHDLVSIRFDRHRWRTHAHLKPDLSPRRENALGGGREVTLTSPGMSFASATVGDYSPSLQPQGAVELGPQLGIRELVFDLQQAESQGNKCSRRRCCRF